jgi:flagellin
MVIAGDYVSASGYAAAYKGLAGTVTYDGHVFDLESADYTGAVTAQDHLDRLDAAAVQALGAGFVPFTATASGLQFVTRTPAPHSTDADAALLLPSYRGRAATGGDISAIDRALTRVSSVRAHLGALQNGLEHTVQRLGVEAGNAAAAESRIRDADVAAEVVSLSRARLVSDVGAALSAQANQSAAALLRLLV